MWKDPKTNLQHEVVKCNETVLIIIRKVTKLLLPRNKRKCHSNPTRGQASKKQLSSCSLREWGSVST